MISELRFLFVRFANRKFQRYLDSDFEKIFVYFYGVKKDDGNGIYRIRELDIFDFVLL